MDIELKIKFQNILTAQQLGIIKSDEAQKRLTCLLEVIDTNKNLFVSLN